jgi:hypothetical protein
MKQEIYVKLMLGLLVLITITGCAKKEPIPGTRCSIDSDCKYISWTTNEGKTGAMCAVPAEYSHFFNVNVNVDINKECYCKTSNVCALK